MDWIAIWKLVRTFGLPLALALSLLGNWHLSSRANYWHSADVQCGVDRKADQQKYADATAKATKDNKATVAATETKWKNTVATNEKTYEANLNDAYARIDAYASSLRRTASTTPRGNTGSPAVPATTGTPGVGEGTGSSTLVPVPQSDLYICAENTVKAQKWQELWGNLVADWPKNTDKK